MDILLTFTGFHDPYFKGLVGHEEQPGPILSLLSARSFEQVILFSTPQTDRVTLETQDAISTLYPEIDINILDMPLDDPTDYAGILKGLREHIREIQEALTDATFFVAVASGTPQMHACWFLLCAAGEIPARLLHVRPPHFVTKERPLVSEIDLTSNEFPIVRSQLGVLFADEDIPVDWEAAVN
ncbi:MAG: hypothetical protein GXP49_14585, partial [Deltaproteobacteria bacterium]|nr:hypothetical protein [Deltaproteobacteria bacterium]